MTEENSGELNAHRIIVSLTAEWDPLTESRAHAYARLLAFAEQRIDAVLARLYLEDEKAHLDAWHPATDDAEPQNQEGEA